MLTTHLHLLSNSLATILHDTLYQQAGLSRATLDFQVKVSILIPSKNIQYVNNLTVLKSNLWGPKNSGVQKMLGPWQFWA